MPEKTTPYDPAVIYAEYNDGNSFTEIAQHHGMTRSAVAGIVYRHKTKVSGIPPRKRGKTQASAKLVGLSLVRVDGRSVKHPRWVTLLETGKHTCRWTDDGKLFCNAPSGEGSYCSVHKKSMVDKSTKKRQAWKGWY